MTCQRRDGNESPFSSWLRRQRQLDSVIASLHISDVDYSVLKYKHVVDGIGSRNLKCMMLVELKTFGKQLDKYQQEHLFLLHQLLTHQRPLPAQNKVKGFTGFATLYSPLEKTNVDVKTYGQSILTIFGSADPDCCEKLQWGRFQTDGSLKHFNITKDQLHGLLNFDLHPDTLNDLHGKRHHKIHEGEVIRDGPDFLFPVVERVTSMSASDFKKKMGKQA